jgi:hypothetical protein
MKRAIASAMAALLFAATLAPPFASAKGRDEPPPPYPYWQSHGNPPPGHDFRDPPNDHWKDRGRPPPGWGRSEWQYRRDWLRRHGHDDDDHDAATGLIVGAILGFVLNAAIADTREHQDYARSRLNDPGWIAYCARKYASFDPYSGTYMGRDGLRHYCR